MDKGFKFGNTSFNINKLAFKNRSEFMKRYKNKMTSSELDEAWNELKKYLKVEKPKKESE